MKVYYAMGLYEGCNYVRCLLPLINNGWDGDYTSLDGKRISPASVMGGMLDADVVVFQRPFEIQKKPIYEILKEAGKKIVFDNDDTYKDKTQAYGMEELLDKVANSMDWFIKESDLVTTTTEFLAEEYRKINPNVIVIPNLIDPTDFPSKLEKNKTKKVRIGLIGSVVGVNDFDHIKDVLKELSERDDVQLVVMSTKPNKGNFFDNINVEWHEPVRINRYHDKLNSLKLDIMLIPRKENYFNKCKSNIKFLESSMYEIPCITDDWKDNPYTKDRDYLIMTKNWKKSINELIDDKEFRRALGKRAKKYVLKNYSIKDKAHLWEEAYQTIL